MARLRASLLRITLGHECGKLKDPLHQSSRKNMVWLYIQETFGHLQHKTLNNFPYISTGFFKPYKVAPALISSSETSRTWSACCLHHAVHPWCTFSSCGWNALGRFAVSNHWDVCWLVVVFSLYWWSSVFNFGWSWLSLATTCMSHFDYLRLYLVIPVSHTATSAPCLGVSP